MTEYYYQMACKTDFWARTKITSSGVILFSFLCVVVDCFLLWRAEHLHILYSSHYPLGTAVGGLSNSENPDEQLLRKVG